MPLDNIHEFFEFRIGTVDVLSEFSEDLFTIGPPFLAQQTDKR